MKPSPEAVLAFVMGFCLALLVFAAGCAWLPCSPLALSGDGRCTPAVAFRPCPPPRLLAVPCP